MIKQFIILFLILTGSVYAKDIDPSKIKIGVNTVKSGTPFHPPLGEYTYTASWAGIPAADMTVSINKEKGFYKIKTFVKTYSGIDVFYKLRYKAESLISSINLRPFKSIFDYQENSRKKHTQIAFKANKVKSDRTKNGKKEKQIAFTSDSVLDPFSAAFIARSINWKKGLIKRFDTFNGKSRYLITLKAIDKETIKYQGKKKDVWVIQPKVTKLTSRKRNNKLKDAKIYVTADKKRDIIKIKSEVFVGNVNTNLVDFKPNKDAYAYKS